MDENTIPPPSTPPQPPISSPPPVTPPPPLNPPPVILPPGGSPPPRRGRGWMILALILMVLLGISLFLNLGSFASIFLGGSAVHARSAGPRLEEVTVEEHGGSDKIAVIEVEGIITSYSGDGRYNLVDIIRAEFDRAKEDNRVRAVILKVNSPGGEVLASDEIYRIVADFQKKSRKPVIASMGNVAASGGYYVSAPCRWIVANELTITGSIGVIMSSWNYRGLMNKVGIQPQKYKSGKFKDMLSGDRTAEEIPEEERAMVQALIDEVYGRFKEVVGSGRAYANELNRGSKDKGQALREDWVSLADGRVLSGSEAKKAGFVDELGNFQDAVNRAESIAGIRRASLIQYEQIYDFSDFFRMFGKSSAPKLKLDLGIEPPRLQPGYLYFIAPNFAN